MKKSVLWSVALLPLLMLLASSCSQEVVESKKDRTNQIAFKAAVGKQTVTKAQEFLNSSWTNGNSFVIHAFNTGGAAFTPSTFTLTYNSGSWSYGTPVLHPGPGITSLTYYAYYPATGVTTPTFNGTDGSFGYTIQSTQVDLIATKTVSNLAAVTLTFNHLLSQVNFAIKGFDGVKIEVKNISVNGVKNSGTFAYNAAGWSSLSGSASYNYTPVGSAITDGTDAILYLGNKGGTNQADNNNANALMLMPQPLGTATIKFDYEIKNAISEVVMDAANNVEVDLIDLVANWLPGKRYLFLLDFSSLLSEDYITFTVVVNEWLDDSGSPFIVPID